MNYVRTRGLVFATTILLLAFVSSPVFAVVKINQSKAEAGGVTSGDSAGFPVTISVAGSYQLTGNLTVAGANKTAIDVTAEDVTINLNGYSITGPTVCTGSGSSISCTPTGTGRGINGTGITVFNGTVRGMGETGIQCGTCSVTNVHATNNGGNGIYVNNGIISGSRADYNGQEGFDLNGGTISGSTAMWNGLYGLWVGSGVAQGNTLNSNGSAGIYANFNATILNNMISYNEGYGVSFSACSSGFGSNVINNNTLGEISGCGTLQIGTNICGGDTTCP